MFQVFKDDEGFKVAWFTTNILSLKDGKAYVYYATRKRHKAAMRDYASFVVHLCCCN